MLELSKPEAIVLIQFLMRYRDRERLAVEHDAEEQLLWDLCAVLEQKVPELLDPRWGELLETSRAAILDDSGL